MIRAVIFDMDGVVVDSERLWHEFELEFISSIVKNPEPLWPRFAGASIENIYDVLREERGLTMERDQFLAVYDREAVALYGEKAELVPGCLPLIRSLRDAGFKLALASSSRREWVRIVLERFSLEEFFGVAVSAQDLDGRGKPDPAVFVRAAELLSVPPCECLVIEDSENGITAAKRAGMFCVGFHGMACSNQNLDSADRIIGDFSELTIEIIREINR